MPGGEVDILVNVQRANDVDNLADSVKEVNQESEKLARTFSKGIDQKGTKQVENNFKKVIDLAKKEEKELKDLIKLQKQLEIARKKSTDTTKLKQYDRALAKTNQSIKNIKRSTDDTAKSTNKLRNSFSSVGKSIVAFVGIGAAIRLAGQALRRASEFGREFERSLKELQAITGASQKDLEEYEKIALANAKSFQLGTVSAIDYVEALKLVGSAKPELLSNRDALVDLTNKALILSQASGLDLNSSVAALSATLNSFNEDAREGERIINILAAAAQKGAKEVPFITAALTRTGTSAFLAGESIETTVAAIEILGKVIPQAEKVGTGLNTTLTRLKLNAERNGRAYKGLAGELELLAPQIDNTVELTKIFGIEQLKIAQVLITNREDLTALTEAITDTGIAHEQAAINTDTLAAAQARLNNRWDATIQGSGSLGRALSSLVNTFSDLIDEFDNFSASLEVGGAGGGPPALFARRIDKVSESSFEWLVNTRLVQEALVKLNLTSIDKLADDVEGNTIRITEALQEQGRSYEFASLFAERFIQTRAAISDDETNVQIIDGAIKLTKVLKEQSDTRINTLRTEREDSKNEGIGNIADITKALSDEISIRNDFVNQLEDLQRRSRDLTAEQALIDSEAASELAKLNKEKEVQKNLELQEILRLNQLIKLKASLTEQVKNVQREQKEENVTNAGRILLIEKEAELQDRISGIEVSIQRKRLQAVNKQIENGGQTVALLKTQTQIETELIKLQGVRLRNGLDAEARIRKARKESQDELKAFLQEIEDLTDPLDAGIPAPTTVDVSTFEQIDEHAKNAAKSTSELSIRIRQLNELLGSPQFIGAIDLAGSAFNAYTAGLDSAISKNDEFISSLDETISTLERNVEEQQDLAERGLANNLSIAERELADQNRLRNEALAQQEKAVERKRKIDQISANASLGVSIANILQQSTLLPPGIGLIVAAASIATLLTLFQNSVEQANTISLAKGGSGSDTGMVSGHRHAQGGESFTSQIEVERGEKWGVLSRFASNKYGGQFHNIVEQMNAGRFNPDLEQIQNIQDNRHSSMDSSGMERLIGSGNRELRTLNKSLSGKRTTSDNGKIITVRGNKTTIRG